MSPRIRIAELFFFLDMGGVERCIVDLVNALPHEDFDIQVILSHHGGMMERQIPPDIAVTCLPEKSRMLDLVRILASVDIAHIHTTNMNPFFTWASAMADVPVILETVHASVDNPYASYLDHTVCVSRFVQNLQSRPERSSVIYNGVPVRGEDVRPSPGGRDTVVIAEMRRPDKELALSLADLHDPLECGENRIECWVLGVEGRSRPGLSFFGKVADPMDYLSRADFLFHFPGHEAFGSAVVEALSCGLIPVTNGVGGIPEIVQDGVNGICAGDRRADEVVRLLKGLVSEHRQGSERLRSMRGNGLRTVRERFDVTRTHKAYETLFHDLMRRGRVKDRRPLSDLLPPGGPEAHASFLSLLEEYCFDQVAGSRRLQGDVPESLTPRQKAFLLGITGRELHLQNRAEEARRLFAEALEKWQEDFYLHLFMGETERELGFANRSRERFSKAFSMDQTNMLGVFGHLQSLLETGDFASAKRLCEQKTAVLPPANPGKAFLDRFCQTIAPLSQST